MCKAEIIDKLNNFLILFLFWYAEFEPGSKSKRFSYRKISENNIVLHHIAGEASECILIELVSVIELNLPSKLVSLFETDTVGKYVEQTCFSRAWRSHNEVGLTWEKYATAFFQDMQMLMFFPSSGAVRIAYLDFVVNVSEAYFYCIFCSFDRFFCDSVKIVMISRN